MTPPLFLKYKLERQIDSHGLKYTFSVAERDEYNQLVEGNSVTIEGLYHELNSFISVATSDAAILERKKKPMILTLMSDDVKKITQGSKIEISGVVYKVSGILDIQNYGVAADISLEMEV